MLQQRKRLTVYDLSYIFNIRGFKAGNLKKEFNMGTFIRTLTLLTGLLLAVSGAALAEDFEYEDYTIKRGDTLWDITDVKLEDPFNWPIVWRENPQIKNPDLIFPGQKIRIPVGLLRKPETTIAVEAAPEAAMPVAAPAEPEAVSITVREDAYQISADDILRGGYITFDVPRDGEVVGSPGRRIALGVDDEVYVSVADSPKAGDKFYVIRRAEKVRHPVTNKKMGYLVRVMGVIEITRVGQKDVTARILRMFDDVQVGDYLHRYYEVEPLIFTGEARKPEVEGVVVASTDMRLLNGMLEMVYIDRGAEDGLMPGDVIAALAPGTPDRANGVLMVVGAKEKTSTLVVLGSIYDVGLGHAVSSCANVEGCAIR